MCSLGNRVCIQNIVLPISFMVLGRNASHAVSSLFQRVLTCLHKWLLSFFLKEILCLYIAFGMVTSLIFHAENSLGLLITYFIGPYVLMVGLLVLFKVFLGWKDDYFSFLCFIAVYYCLLFDHCIGFSLYVPDEQYLMIEAGGAGRVTWTAPQICARNKEKSSCCVSKGCSVLQPFQT